MRVLFCVRHNFHTSPGGAQVQILKTCEELRKLGVSCDLTTTPYGVDYSHYDLVHLTDLTWIYDLLEYLKVLRTVKIPRVLSTIYWPFDDYAAHGAPIIQKLVFQLFGINGFEYAKALMKFILQRQSIYLAGLSGNYIANQRMIAQNVDWLLPNSEMELEALNSRLNLNPKNYSVVNNAIDVAIFDGVIAKSAVTRDANIITFVGRIDPRKNQLNFLRAIYDTPYHVQFIGQAAPNSSKYYRKLRSLAEMRGNTEFITQVPQEKVFEYMLGAKANALTSWVETPGLVSLEAIYAGCNIIVADKGSVREYFKEHAFYCAPDDLDSIRTATDNAMQSPCREGFQEIIRREYSWQNAARQTLDAYERVLSLYTAN